jgi:hypothetical protein
VRNTHVFKMPNNAGRDTSSSPDTPAPAPTGGDTTPSPTGGDTSAPSQPPPQLPQAQDTLSGGWQGKVAYAFQQNGSSFSWWSQDLQESAQGTIDGDALTVSWTGPNGNGGMTGQVVAHDANGRATQIQWSNGQTWVRVN